VRSIRVLQKIIGDPYYEPTIVVHDNRIKILTENSTKHCSVCSVNVHIKDCDAITGCSVYSLKLLRLQ